MNSRKRYILTHPLTGNYGGLLQAFALYTSINKLGFQAYIYRYQPDDMPLGIKDYWRYFKRHIKYCLGKCNEAHTVWRRLAIARKFLKGVRFFDERNLAKLPKEAAFVVGSDQVWRAIFCRMMKHTAYYFLDFVSAEQRQRSIAYAPSFGIDEWEGTPEETAECARLLQDFKAVSVREHSGVNICREHLGTHSVQMPDPTMLLERREYEQLIKREHTWRPASPYIAAYVIDENPERRESIEKLSQQLGLPIQHLLPHADAPRLRDRFAPSVGQWLRLIRDCDYFITDSFHGSVFAIIFNKPFICLGNEGRGAARFESLLSTFDLQNKITSATSVQEMLQILTDTIDWTKINSIREEERKRGINFISNAFSIK